MSANDTNAEPNDDNQHDHDVGSTLTTVGQNHRSVLESKREDKSWADVVKLGTTRGTVGATRCGRNKNDGSKKNAVPSKKT